jgi:hypothetical protein
LFLLFLIELLAEDCFLLKMASEGSQLVLDVLDHVHVRCEDVVERVNVLLDVRAWFVHFIENRHLFLDEFYVLVDVLSMHRQKLFFFSEDDIDHEFVFLLQFLNVHVLQVLLLILIPS